MHMHLNEPRVWQLAERLEGSERAVAGLFALQPRIRRALGVDAYVAKLEAVCEGSVEE